MVLAVAVALLALVLAAARIATDESRLAQLAPRADYQLAWTIEPPSTRSSWREWQVVETWSRRAFLAGSLAFSAWFAALSLRRWPMWTVEFALRTRLVVAFQTLAMIAAAAASCSIIDSAFNCMFTVRPEGIQLNQLLYAGADLSVVLGVTFYLSALVWVATRGRLTATTSSLGTPLLLGVLAYLVIAVLYLSVLAAMADLVNAIGIPAPEPRA